MRDTLLEVLGPERGRDLYTDDWLLERVRYHLAPAASRVVWVVDGDEDIDGHAIARLESDHGDAVCHFSTLYVRPSCRRRGLAGALIETIERWAVERRVRSIRYDTAHDHQLVISMFERRGYAIAVHAGDMVRLSKQLA